MTLGGRKLIRENFLEQFRRWVVVCFIPFSIADNIETLRLFRCFDPDLQLESASTMRNRLMKKVTEIEGSFLVHLPTDGTKLSLNLDNWSSNNRQSCMAFIVFFIDLNWNWHENLLRFEYVESKHSGTKLAKIVNPIFMKHDIDFEFLF